MGGGRSVVGADWVAILIRVGFVGTIVVELGRQLLVQFGSLRAMVEAPVLALLEVKGLRAARGCSGGPGCGSSPARCALPSMSCEPFA